MLLLLLFDFFLFFLRQCKHLCVKHIKKIDTKCLTIPIHMYRHAIIKIIIKKKTTKKIKLNNKKKQTTKIIVHK